MRNGHTPKKGASQFNTNALRKHLRDDAYDPIPVITNGKKPLLDKWQTKIKVSDAEIDSWDKRPGEKSTGLLTHRLPGFDIDIKVLDAAVAVEKLVHARFKGQGKILVRVGYAPKRLVPFKTDKPFKKIVVNLIAPGDIEHKGQKIELLAEGQQFVAFGIHEDTRKPYLWFGGEPGKIKRSELPSINEAEARKLVDDAVELLIRDHGYKRAKERPEKDRGNGDGAASGGSEDWAYLIGSIREGHQLHNSTRDLAMKLVASGMGGGAAVNFIRGLMDASDVRHDQRWKDRRDDIIRLVESAEAKLKADKAAEIASWPDPVDLWGKFDPPELPRGLLPKLIEDYAFTQAKRMGVDPSGIAVSGLVVCASAITDRIQLNMRKYDDQWRESARVWAGLVGPPSTKKSPIISNAVDPLKEPDKELLNNYLSAKVRYNNLSKEEKAREEAPLEKRLRMTDTTIEAAQDVLHGSPDGLLLDQDELSGWFGSMDKYGGKGGAAKDRGFWLSSFNGGSYPINRVGRGSFIIPNHSTNVIGGIQNDVIRKLSAESYDDGFMQRMILVVLRPAGVGEDAPAPPAAEAYAELIERLLELTPPPKPNIWKALQDYDEVLRFDAKAQKILEELDQRHVRLQELLETINKKLSTSIGKYNGYFGKLCVLFHCIDHAYEKSLPRVVTEATARRVANFLQSFVLPHAVAFYSGVLGLADDHDRLANFAGFILARKMERVTNRDIARGDGSMRKLYKRGGTEEMFEQLEALGWLARTAGGRTTKVGTDHWLVNPKVHIQFAERGRNEAKRRGEAQKLILQKVLKSKESDYEL